MSLVTWWGWIAATSCQLVVLVAVVALVDHLLRARAWPELRMGLWSLVMIKLVLPPSLSAPWSVASIGPAVAESSVALPLIAPWVFLLWACGATLFLAGSLLRYRVAARRLLAGAGPASPELRALAARLAARLPLARVPEVLVAQRTASALVLGFLRPRVVLPQALASCVGSAELDHVLLHELAHCKRRDPLQGLVCLVLHSAFWFHPLVWWAAARLFALRELCCDQAVVRALGGDPVPYRATLLRHAAALLHARPAGVHAFWHPASMLLQRLALLQRRSTWGRASRTATTCAATFLFALACVPLGAPAAAVFDPRSLSLEELPGCLQKRWLVLSALARLEQPDK